MTKICKRRIFLKKGFRVSLYPLLVSNFMQNIKKMAFLQKNYNIVLNVLWYSIFMQNGLKTVQKI
jgi:hypothetical protein